MTRKILSSFIVLFAYFILPLSMNPILIIHPKVFILMISAVILIITQPSLSLDEAKEKKISDKNSILIIMLSTLIVQIVSIIEWGYFQKPFLDNYADIKTIIGLIMMVMGISFRVWSINVLDKYFTATVQIKNNHQLITTGPYAFIRHPSYLGAYLAIIGSTIFLNTILGTILAITCMFYAYYKRICAEEFTLVSAFGNLYKQYQNQTTRMIPYLW